MAGTDQLSRVFSAPAGPTRRAILSELAERDARLTDPNHLASLLDKLDATLFHIQATATDAEA